MDLLDLLCEWAAAFPGWLVDGEPCCWRHFIYGLHYIERARARDSLRMHGAVLAAWAKQDDAKEWRATQRMIAGW